MVRIIFVFLFFTSSAFAEVYRYTDSEGNVVFSDKPIPGAEKLSISSPPVAPSLKTTPNNSQPTSPNAFSGAEEKAKPPAFAGYKSLKVSNPIDDTALRSNAGEVAISVKLEPELEIGLGHRFAVLLDNRPLPGSWTQTSWSLSNIDRGTHTLQVLVTDATGSKTLVASPSIRFHLLRAAAGL